MRRVAFALVVAASTACSPAPGPAAVASAPRATPAPAPRLVVTVVVDQLAAWVASERWPLLPPSGGFARLLREGTWAKELRYAHAVTDTAPGHSALYTGAVPRASGIALNEILDGKGGKVSILRDERKELVGVNGVIAGSAGASLAALHVDTLADRVRAARPDAFVVSLSLKDRGALFGGGRSPDAALWLDLKGAQFVTSTAFARTLPRWAAPLASAEAVGRLRAEVWRPLDAAWVAANAKTPDAQEGEGDAAGLGIVFPHALAGTEPFAKALRTTPFADDALFALALAALDAPEALGRPALLALSLSANDYVGHTFGPDSWEAWDELERLDASLARFLAALDARFGADGYTLLLTGDHGTTTMPEAAAREGTRPWCTRKEPDRWERACGAVARILPGPLADDLRRAAAHVLGEGDWVLGVDDPYVFLTREARALDAPRRHALDQALIEALRSRADIAEVFDVRTLPTPCPPERDESIAALVCRSIAEPSGDLYVVPRRGSFFDPDVVVGKGTSHGTPYLYDRAVPLVIRAPGRAAAHAVVEEAVSFEAFARTAATLLGIEPPAAAKAARDFAR